LYACLNNANLRLAYIEEIDMKRICIALIIATLSISLFACSHMADDQVHALVTQASNGDAVALQKLTKMANDGDPRAQNGIGVLYFTGKGEPQDYTQAADWYLKAANQGYGSAQYNLSTMYRDGKGVPQDYAQSIMWARKAADQGDTDAMVAIGVAYVDGKGVPQDYKQAAEWYRKAAVKGNTYAQTSLGILYSEGKGVPQDNKQAADWLSKAAKQGNNDAKNLLANLYTTTGVTPTTPLETLETKVEQGDAAVLQQLTDTANNGDANAQYALGYLYYEGKGVPKDDAIAESWLVKADSNKNGTTNLWISAEKLLLVIRRSHGNAGWKEPSSGPDDADYEKAITYSNNGPSQNFILARQYFEKAGDAGDPRAMFYTAIMYFNGQGGDASWDKANEWMLKGANANYPPAMLTYTYYLHGANFMKLTTTSKDDTGVVALMPNSRAEWEWVEKAAALHFGQAEDWIGISYFYGPGIGDGVAPYGCSLEKGVEYFERAGADGVPDAYSRLLSLYSGKQYTGGDASSGICFAAVPQDYDMALKYALLAQKTGADLADMEVTEIRGDISLEKQPALDLEKVQQKNTSYAAYTKVVAEHDIQLAKEAIDKSSQVKNGCFGATRVGDSDDSAADGMQSIMNLNEGNLSSDPSYTIDYNKYPNIKYKQVDDEGRLLFKQLADAGCLYPGLKYPDPPK